MSSTTEAGINTEVKSKGHILSLLEQNKPAAIYGFTAVLDGLGVGSALSHGGNQITSSPAPAVAGPQPLSHEAVSPRELVIVDVSPASGNFGAAKEFADDDSITGNNTTVIFGRPETALFFIAQRDKVAA